MLGHQGSRKKICQVKRPSVWGKRPSPHPLLDASGVAATSPCRLVGSGRCEGQVREAIQSRDPRAACQPRQPQEVPAPPAACGPAPPDTHRMNGFHSEEEEEREKERASERQREAFGKTERSTKRQMQREELLGKRTPGCWSQLLWGPSREGGTRVPAQRHPLHPQALPCSEPHPAALRVRSWAFSHLLPMSGPGRPVSSGLPVLLM